jgi:hypothetical protein
LKAGYIEPVLLEHRNNGGLSYFKINREQFSAGIFGSLESGPGAGGTSLANDVH